MCICLPRSTWSRIARVQGTAGLLESPSSQRFSNLNDKNQSKLLGSLHDDPFFMFNLAMTVDIFNCFCESKYF